MKKNVLKQSDISIVLSYEQNGKILKFDVTPRYTDDEETYLSMPMPIDFVKPKNKTNLNLTLRSSIGVLKAVTKLIDCNLSLQEIIFTVQTPKNWENNDYRRSSRKEAKLPVIIKCNDTEIKTESFDVSMGGISVIVKEEMFNFSKNIPVTITIYLGNDELTVQGKFIREKEVYLEKSIMLMVYKFTNINNIAQLILKKNLIDM